MLAQPLFRHLNKWLGFIEVFIIVKSTLHRSRKHCSRTFWCSALL